MKHEMSKAKFTPGPWVWEPCINDGGRIAMPYAVGPSRQVASASHQDDLNEHEANAHLIAAAPDLYEALEGMLAAWCGPKKSDIVDQAKEALAKARGKEAEDE